MLDAGMVVRDQRREFFLDRLTETPDTLALAPGVKLPFALRARRQGAARQ